MPISQPVPQAIKAKGSRTLCFTLLLLLELRCVASGLSPSWLLIVVGVHQINAVRFNICVVFFVVDAHDDCAAVSAGLANGVAAATSSIDGDAATDSPPPPMSRREQEDALVQTAASVRVRTALSSGRYLIVPHISAADSGTMRWLVQ